MITEIDLPQELMESAKSLEQRLNILHVPTRRVSIAAWNVVPEDKHHLIPSWIPTLLANFSLLGGVLECQHNDGKAWQKYFCFWGPAEFKSNLTNDNLAIYRDEFVSKGMIMISDESNLDMWLTSISNGPSSPVYLFDQSGHEYIFASSRIALLMASMAVSPESFHSFGRSLRYQSVMWRPEI